MLGATLAHPAPTPTLPRVRGMEWEGPGSALSRNAAEDPERSEGSESEHATSACDHG